MRFPRIVYWMYLIFFVYRQLLLLWIENVEVEGALKEIVLSERDSLGGE